MTEKLGVPQLHLLIFAITLIVSAQVQAADPQNSHKVALVLSGGGARGASHVGVLQVLEREGIPIDCIAGTSFGALVGGLYAIGYSTNEIQRILSAQDWNSILSDTPKRRLIPLIQRGDSRYQAQLPFKGWTPELPAGFRGGQRLTESLDLFTTSRMLSAEYDFDRLPIQFRAVSTNLIDGKAYIFSQGSMTEALRASMAIPLLFTPVEKDGMLLADGGLTDNLPTDVARRLGADIVIAVDATSPLLKKDEIRNFVDVVDQSTSLQMVKNAQENRGLADIVLQPRLDEFTYNDFDKIPEIVKRGEEEAERVVGQLKSLVAGIPTHTHSAPPAISEPTVGSISFRGLKRIKAEQLAGDVRVRSGQTADPAAIGADVERLYATRLFDTVGYALEPLGDRQYRLVYIVKESPINSLGASLRYDNDYNFVALAELTAHRLFNSPSTGIISSQFGGLQDHFAALRFIPPSAPFLFMEPRGEILRLERLDVRNKTVVDRFTDKREGGGVLIGGSIFKQFEIAGGYRIERVRIDDGVAPNRLIGSMRLAGPAFRLTWDSLDVRYFPNSGTAVKVLIDKRSKSFGSDLDYSKWEADCQRYFSLSEKSTFQIDSELGYSLGPVPFYDLFFVGGYSSSQIASRQFFGFKRDELAVNQMAILGASYRRQLFSRSLSIVRQGYLTAVYNGGFFSNRQASPYNFNFVNGAGIGISLDTVLGPFRATGGWGEAGRWNYYISFGPSF